MNEGAKILEEGIAQRASDIDLVYLAGYGFPPFRGGPMFYADTVGPLHRRAPHEGAADSGDGDPLLDAGPAAGPARRRGPDVQSPVRRP